MALWPVAVAEAWPAAAEVDAAVETAALCAVAVTVAVVAPVDAATVAP